MLQCSWTRLRHQGTPQATRPEAFACEPRGEDCLHTIDQSWVGNLERTLGTKYHVHDEWGFRTQVKSKEA